MNTGNTDMAAWSGIRNKLENDYLAESLRGHIQYYATSYSRSPYSFFKRTIKHMYEEELINGCCIR